MLAQVTVPKGINWNAADDTVYWTVSPTFREICPTVGQCGETPEALTKRHSTQQDQGPTKYWQDGRNAGDSALKSA
ncbi:uncharacterized protein N7496_004520 [Penicillium cataractarum]|uniref:Uncharacterized protein n=1 Tax=Penicillium cataractarum TaxID=2100454 RepID=A0A9W9VF50_9EURO|nr:uncharacterized protein N7496_004520 [Penicillium cataractarum]KAJ5377111.1 hypothetical protein N7496_004520 [Penicillium cataractarum]